MTFDRDRISNIHHRYPKKTSKNIIFGCDRIFYPKRQKSGTNKFSCSILWSGRGLFLLSKLKFLSHRRVGVKDVSYEKFKSLLDSVANFLSSFSLGRECLPKILHDCADGQVHSKFEIFEACFFASRRY